MSSQREQHLEQALLAVLAAIGQQGCSVTEVGAQAVGGLMSDRYWQWANPVYKHGAADEIDEALVQLFNKLTSNLIVGDRATQGLEMGMPG